MSNENLQDKADLTISSILTRYLGFDPGIKPVEFNTDNYRITANWTWSIKPDIQNKTVAGTFKNCDNSKYFNTIKETKNTVATYAVEAAEGKHGTYNKMVRVTDSSPMKSFGHGIINLGSMQNDYNHQEDCNTCSGTGQNRCSSCGGNGNTTCYTCHGSSRMNCGTCGGSGRTFNGTNNNATCGGCGGSGKVHCYNCNGGTVRCNTCAGNGQVSCGSCSGQGFFTTRYWVNIKAVSSWALHYPKNITDWGKCFLKQCLGESNGRGRILQNAAFEEVENDAENKKSFNLSYKMVGELPLSEYYIDVNSSKTDDELLHKVQLTGINCDGYNFDHIIDTPANEYCEDFFNDIYDLEKAQSALRLPVNNIVLEKNGQGKDQHEIEKESLGAISAGYVLNFYNNGFIKLVEHLKSLRKTRFKQRILKFSASIFAILLIGGVALNTLYSGINWSGTGVGMLVNDFTEATKPLTNLYNKIVNRPSSGNFLALGIAYASSAIVFMFLGPLKIFTRRNLRWAIVFMPVLIILIGANMPVIEQVANKKLYIPSSFPETSQLVTALTQSLRQSIGMLLLSILLGLSLSRKTATWTMNREAKSIGNKYVRAAING